MQKVVEYLIDNWETYEQMALVEEKENERIEALKHEIKVALSGAASFPKDWIVRFSKAYEGPYLRAYPKSWNVENRQKPLAHVEFGQLTLDGLLATKSDDRSWVALYSNYDGRHRLPKIQSWCKGFRARCVTTDTLVNKYEYESDYRTSDGVVLSHTLEKVIERDILMDDQNLIDFIIQQMMPLVRFTEKIRASYEKAPA